MATQNKLPLDQVLDRMWIDLDGPPFSDLSKGKTLRAVHHKVGFVLAGPKAELNFVLAEGREMQLIQADLPVVVALIDDDDLSYIDAACGWDGTLPWSHNVPVRDLNMNGVGSIRLNTVGGTDSPCEHGYMARYAMVARMLHKGDLFMVVDRNEDGLPLVYRALAEYDRRKDRVLFERTTPGLGPQEKQYMYLPPNLLIHASYEEVEEARPLPDLPSLREILDED